MFSTLKTHFVDRKPHKSTFAIEWINENNVSRNKLNLVLFFGILASNLFIKSVAVPKKVNNIHIELASIFCTLEKFDFILETTDF